MSNVKNRCPGILSAWCACWPSPIKTCCFELVFESLQLVGWSPYAFSIYLGSRAWLLSCQFENFHFRCKYWRELKLRFNLGGESAEKPAGAERAGVAGRSGVEILTRRLSILGSKSIGSCHLSRHPEIKNASRFSSIQTLS